jgi:hypothetical protein
VRSEEGEEDAKGDNTDLPGGSLLMIVTDSSCIFVFFPNTKFCLRIKDCCLF